MQSLISVIIPCYNSSTTIERAVKSVLGQTYDNLEIIVIDDASKDSELTLEKLNSFKDKRIKSFFHKVNKNGSAARNTGIINASGEYIALLDSDDEWLPDHLEKSLRSLQECLNDNCIVYCKSIIKTNHHQDLELPGRGVYKSEKLSEYLFCNKGYMPTPSLFGPSMVFKNNLFAEDLRRHQDYDFLLRLEFNGIPFVFSNHLGVIVHWENNDTEKKGGTWDFSLNFAEKNKIFFTPKAYSYFLLKNVVYPLFRKKQRIKGWGIFIRHCSVFKINIKEWIFFIDYLFFGKLTFIKLYGKVKNENH
jgi:glycosyltransferase involved in cell wall biosynthesis